MPEIKRKGVLIRPGKFTLYGNEEIRTIGELKQAIERQKDGFMLTYGHAKDGSGVPAMNQFLGHAYPYWDSSEKAVMASYVFDEKYWDTIPEDIRNKIVNGDKVPISMGYKVDEVDKDGYQKGIWFSHASIVPPDEKPIDETVGVNTRLESQSQQTPLMRKHSLPPNYREESTEIPSTEPQPEENQPVLEAHEETIEETKDEAPIEQEPEETEEQPEPEAVETQAVPSVVIPANDAEEHPWTVLENGMIEFKPLQIKKQ